MFVDIHLNNMVLCMSSLFVAPWYFYYFICPVLKVTFSPIRFTRDESQHIRDSTPNLFLQTFCSIRENDRQWIVFISTKAGVHA